MERAGGSWSVRARGSQVGTSRTDVCQCLNFIMAGRCASCRGTGGGCCTWLFHIKQKHGIHQHAFLSPNIQHSTFHHSPRANSPPLSPERKTCCMLHLYVVLGFWLFSQKNIPLSPCNPHEGHSLWASAHLSCFPSYKHITMSLRLKVGASL